MSTKKNKANRVVPHAEKQSPSASDSHPEVKHQKSSSSKEATPPHVYDRFVKGKEIYYLLGLSLAVCAIVFADFISMEKVYLFKDIGSDSLNIYFPWLAGTSDYLKTESSLAWSFAQGMGQNMFPLSIGDFFSNFLTYFDKSKIPYGLAFIEIVKILLTGFVFFRYLKELKVSDFTALLFAFLFAFSGYIVCFHYSIRV
jgi:hypothetical protein